MTLQDGDMIQDFFSSGFSIFSRQNLPIVTAVVITPTATCIF